MVTRNKLDDYKNTNPTFVWDNTKIHKFNDFQKLIENTQLKNISTDSILAYSESMRILDWSNQWKSKKQNWQW